MQAPVIVGRKAGRINPNLGHVFSLHLGGVGLSHQCTLPRVCRPSCEGFDYSPNSSTSSGDGVKNTKPAFPPVQFGPRISISRLSPGSRFIKTSSNSLTVACKSQSIPFFGQPCGDGNDALRVECIAHFCFCPIWWAVGPLGFSVSAMFRVSHQCQSANPDKCEPRRARISTRPQPSEAQPQGSRFLQWRLLAFLRR